MKLYKLNVIYVNFTSRADLSFYFLLGAAIGFRLDSLLKLTDTRAKNNKMTLMHYLCKVQPVT